MTLPERVRGHLKKIAVQRQTISYRDLARALDVRPPNSIHQVTEALEALMREDHQRGAPFLAALVVSKVRNVLPAPGFFELACGLRRYDGSVSGPRAEAYHAAELESIWTWWGG